MSATRVRTTSHADDAFALALQRAAFSTQAEENPLFQAESVASLLLEEAVEVALWEVVAEAACAAPLRDGRDRRGGGALRLGSFVEYVETAPKEQTRDRSSDSFSEDFSDEGYDSSEDKEEALSKGVGLVTLGEEEVPLVPPPKPRRRRPPLAEVDVVSEDSPLFFFADEEEKPLRQDEFIGDDGVKRQFFASSSSKEFDDEDDEFDEEGDDEGGDDDDDVNLIEVPQKVDFLEEAARKARRDMIIALRENGWRPPLEDDSPRQRSSRRLRRDSFAEVDNEIDVKAKLEELDRLKPVLDEDSDDDSVILEDTEDDISENVFFRAKFSKNAERDIVLANPVARVVCLAGREPREDAVDTLDIIDKARPEDAVAIARLLTGPVLSPLLAKSLDRWINEVVVVDKRKQNKDRSGLLVAATAVVATKLLRYNCGVAAHEFDDSDDDFDRTFPSLFTDIDKDEDEIDPNDVVANFMDEALPATRRRLLRFRDEYLRDDRSMVKNGDTDEAKAVDFILRHGSARVRFDASAALFLRLKMRKALAALLSSAAKDRAVSATVAALDALVRGSDRWDASLQPKRGLAIGRILKARDPFDAIDDAKGRQRAPLCVALLRLDAIDRLGHADALRPFNHLLCVTLFSHFHTLLLRLDVLKERRQQDLSERSPRSAAASAPASLAKNNLKHPAATPAFGTPPWDAALATWLNNSTHHHHQAPAVGAAG